MVIYYSSTGNSEHVALRLHETFKGRRIKAWLLNRLIFFCELFILNSTIFQIIIIPTYV